MKPIAPKPERPGVWPIVLALCAIAVAVSIRRLIVLGNPGGNSASPTAALDALFAAKAGLTRGHVIAGLVLATLIPVQLSARVRSRFPRVHRWLGRTLMVTGIVVGLSGYAMVAIPIGGWLEVTAIVFAVALAFGIAAISNWIVRADLRHCHGNHSEAALSFRSFNLRPERG